MSLENISEEVKESYLMADEAETKSKRGRQPKKYSWAAGAMRRQLIFLPKHRRARRPFPLGAPAFPVEAHPRWVMSPTSICTLSQMYSPHLLRYDPIVES
jgi:hypothetical protein